jgi:O-acetyl-ADP-ribose deacetylase (regulator of RNase III)
MIHPCKGNLLEAPVEALVNTVNTVGVMGKGLALQFRTAFPENYQAYQAACARGGVKVGQMFVTEYQTGGNPRYIINFPTKSDWRDPSRLEYITEGLRDLARVLRERQIKSIALPAVGCGLGGLKWPVVKPLVVEAFAQFPELNVLLFEPTAGPQGIKSAGQLQLARAVKGPPFSP